MHKTRRPYLLPEPLTCDPQLVANGVSMEIVERYIKKHEERAPRYEYLEALYKGFHDVYKQPEKESWKPDNRLAVNFPGTSRRPSRASATVSRFGRRTRMRQ